MLKKTKQKITSVYIIMLPWRTENKKSPSVETDWPLTIACHMKIFENSFFIQQGLPTSAYYVPLIIAS